MQSLQVDERPPLQQIADGVRAWLPAGGLAAFTGAWGVFTGFALFIVVEERIEDWWIPLGAVVLGTVGASVVDWLRLRAEGHPFERPTLPQALSFFVLLAVFELFTYAFDDLMQSSAAWRDIAGHIFGATSYRGIFNALVFMCLWMILAARLASALADAVQRMPPLHSREELVAIHGPELAPVLEPTHRKLVLRRSLWIGLTAGLRVAVVSIPLIVLSYAVLVRLGWAAIDYFITGDWRLPEGETWFAYIEALMLVGAVASAIGERSYGAAAFLALFIGAHIFKWLHSSAGEGVTNLAWQLWQTLILAAETGAIWAAPAIVLGTLAPFLRKPSNYPWLWSPLAFGAAGLSVVMLLLQRQPVLLMVAALLLGSGLLLRSRERVDQLWPLLSASVATMAAIAAAAVVNVTPLGVYRGLEATVLPQPLPETEMIYVSALLSPLDGMTCPAERIARYDEALARIPSIEIMPGATLPDREAMHRFIAERKAFEEAMFEGALLTACDGAGSGSEARPFTRAMSFAVTTIGALSFWVTLGLLAIWQMRNAALPHAPARQPPESAFAPPVPPDPGASRQPS